MRLEVTFHFSPEVTRLLRDQHREVLAAISQMEYKLMSAFTDLKASIEKYIADVETYKATVNQAIATAIAADDAAEDVDLAALEATVDAANDQLTPPVVPPSA